MIYLNGLTFFSVTNCGSKVASVSTSITMFVRAHGLLVPWKCVRTWHTEQGSNLNNYTTLSTLLQVLNWRLPPRRHTNSQLINQGRTKSISKPALTFNQLSTELWFPKGSNEMLSELPRLPAPLVNKCPRFAWDVMNILLLTLSLMGVFSKQFHRVQSITQTFVITAASTLHVAK